MPDTADWKQKYRDSLLEMESEEKRWRQVEQALRRLVGRLCAAGMGVDPQLDDELTALAAANRRNADAVELEKLAASLTMAVVAVDAVSPVPTTIITAAPPFARWDRACSAAAKVLQSLRMVSPDSAAIDLLARLTKADSDGELASVLQKTAEAIQRHGDTLARERTAAAALLADVTRGLEQVSKHLARAGSDAREGFADTAVVNDEVLSQVNSLTAELGAATDLSALRSLVTQRLAMVTAEVLDFRSRSARRLAQHSERVAQLTRQMSELEREISELKAQLDQGKSESRLDTLTRLANRNGFEERLELELQRRSQSDVSVALLIWDLDDFKVINDRYGHRAGDRVLQSVATCLMAGLRAEDCLARIGGEEFAALLPGMTSAAALSVADTLRTKVAALRFHVKGTPIPVSVSCGITELQRDESAATAVDRARAALYRAKRGGKNLCIDADRPLTST